MEDQIETKEENKGLGGIGRVLLWMAGLVVLYVLGVGPVAMLDDRGILAGKAQEFIEETIYAPLEWAYEETPLHKPIGIYLHLWSKHFDKHGELIEIQTPVAPSPPAGGKK